MEKHDKHDKDCCAKPDERKGEPKQMPSASKTGTYLLFGLVAIAAVILVFNQFQLNGIAAALSGGASDEPGTVTATANSVIPTGIPAVYGKELGVSYDDVSPNNPQKADATIQVLGNLDRSIQLSGEALDRYIAIASQISCEYCCGAKAVIFSDGQPACGCAHSYAMRGLAKYLLTEHADMSDNAILEEMGKWKTLFFPGIMQQKADIMKAQGIEMNYINLASNKYRGIEKGAQGGSMVGGC